MPFIHHGFRLQADFSSCRRGFAEHVARRELHQAVPIHQALCLRSLAGSRRPIRISLIDVGSEPGFLDQPFILVSQKMPLNLGDRVHCHADDNEQRCTAKNTVIGACEKIISGRRQTITR